MAEDSKGNEKVSGNSLTNLFRQQIQALLQHLQQENSAVLQGLKQQVIDRMRAEQRPHRFVARAIEAVWGEGTKIFVHQSLNSPYDEEAKPPAADLKAPNTITILQGSNGYCFLMEGADGQLIKCGYPGGNPRVEAVMGALLKAAPYHDEGVLWSVNREEMGTEPLAQLAELYADAQARAPFQGVYEVLSSLEPPQHGHNPAYGYPSCVGMWLDGFIEQYMVGEEKSASEEGQRKTVAQQQLAQDIQAYLRTHAHRYFTEMLPKIREIYEDGALEGVKAQARIFRILKDGCDKLNAELEREFKPYGMVQGTGYMLAMAACLFTACTFALTVAMVWKDDAKIFLEVFDRIRDVKGVQAILETVAAGLCSALTLGAGFYGAFTGKRETAHYRAAVELPEPFFYNTVVGFFSRKPETPQLPLLAELDELRTTLDSELATHNRTTMAWG